MKTCCDCQQTKPFSEFVPKRNTYEPRCRKCRTIRYNKADPAKAFRKIYLSQVDHSATRGHLAPTYSYQDLIDWVDQQPNAQSIWDAYVASGYSKELKPSVDRIDNDKPYELTNIQLMTWAENQQKFATDRKEGRAVVTERRVMAIHPDGMPHKTYHSVMDAVRDINGHAYGISSVANGVPVKDGRGYLYQPKTYKGFIWKWV
jgi:hypothetical protein